MSSLNLKPTPTALLIAGVALYLLMRNRAQVVVTSGQPTTSQQYALWQQLGLPQIVSGLVNATVGNSAAAAQPIRSDWAASYWSSVMGPASTPAQQAAQAQQFYADNPFAALGL